MFRIAALRTLTLVSRPTVGAAFRQHFRPASIIGAARSYSEGPAPLDAPQIQDRVMQLLRDFEKVTPDAHFVNDLGLDSLDQVEITMALEDEFNIELSDKDAEEIFTVRQAVEKIFANKSAM